MFRPEPATGNKDDVELTWIGEEKFTHHSLAPEIVGVWAERSVGPFKVFSASAVDGFGDPQHSWIVECGGVGSFTPATRCSMAIGGGSPIDLNRRCRVFPDQRPGSPVAPSPAIEPGRSHDEAEGSDRAAHIIHAKTVVPIHYGSLNKEPIYVETPNATQRLRNKANEYSIGVAIHEPGEWFVPD